MRDGRLLVGWGMATATYPAGQSPASATVRLRADGTALVQTGSQDIGTGTYTILAQIAADALGLPADRVRVEIGDTKLPEAPLSAGSRTAASVGPAVKGAAERARAAALALGNAGAARDRARRRRTRRMLARAGKSEVVGDLRYRARVRTGRTVSIHAFGAQFAEVTVDPDLGQVRVRRFVGAFATGTVLNAKTGRSQLMGGIVWGIGMALLERTERDARTGRVATRDLADYHVPVNLDVPALDILMIRGDRPRT